MKVENDSGKNQSHLDTEWVAKMLLWEGKNAYMYFRGQRSITHTLYITVHNA